MDDPEKTGLPPFPKLIFFDTNVVQFLHSFGELMYDHFLSNEMERKLVAQGQRFSEDIFALEHFMALGQRAGWPIAVSPNTLDEIEASKRPALIAWGGEMARYFYDTFDESDVEELGNSYSELNHFTAIQRIRLAEMLKELPQESDRQLVIDARECGCDFFLTMDYRTIWRHRQCVAPLGVNVVRPVELVEYIRPWAGLLA